MARVLIVLAAGEGATASIAHRICATLYACGHEPLVSHVANLPAREPLDRYDAVVVGSPIHAGKHDPAIVAWVKEHRSALDAGLGAFFSVCYTDGIDQPKDKEGLRRCLDAFFEETGWKPKLVGCFAGAAVRFSSSRLRERILKRQVAKRHGEAPEGRHNYEYTDWRSVVRFVEDILDLLPQTSASD